MSILFEFYQIDINRELSEINEERKSIEVLFEKMKEENDEHRIEDV